MHEYVCCMYVVTVYVCVCVCVHVCGGMYVCTCIHAWFHLCVCICMHAYMHVHIPIMQNVWYCEVWYWIYWDIFYRRHHTFTHTLTHNIYLHAYIMVCLCICGSQPYVSIYLGASRPGQWKHFWYCDRDRYRDYIYVYICKRTHTIYTRHTRIGAQDTTLRSRGNRSLFWI